MKSDNLELQELTIARDGVPILPPITQRLSAGEVLVLHGRNGSGKSTLLKTVAGLLRPGGGRILFNGQPLHARGAGVGRVAYIGHRSGVEPTLSVRDHIGFWARAFGQPELIDAAMHYFDLEDIADATVGELSAGWRQRVAMARLIVQPASLWLLDEPTANLDADGLQLLHMLVTTRCERGGMVMIASHNGYQGERVQVLDLNTMLEQGDHYVLHA